MSGGVLSCHRPMSVPMCSNVACRVLENVICPFSAMSLTLSRMSILRDINVVISNFKITGP